MVAVVALDKDRRCRFLNAVAEVLTGFTTAQASGLPFKEVVWRRRAGVFEQSELGRLVIEGKAGEGVGSIAGSDQVMRPFSFRVVPLETAGDTIIVEMIDLSGETGSGRALRESEQRLRLAVTTTGLGIWDVDMVDGERRWSPEFLEILGLPLKQRPDLEVFARLIHPDDRSWVIDHHRRAFSNPSASPDAEFRIRRADTGEERWVAVTGQVWFDPVGKPLRGIGTLRDTTDRRRVEDTVRESEERLRLALVAGRMGTWRFNVLTGEHQWDDTQYALLGYGRAVPASQQAFVAVLHADDRARMAAPPSLGADGIFSDAQFRIIRPDGSVRWLSSHSLTRYGPGGAPVEMIGVTHDITQSMEAEMALRASEERNRLAVEGAGIGTWEIDFVKGKRVWSDQCRRLLGLPADAPADPEIVGTLMEPDEFRHVYGLLEAASDPSGDGSLTAEFRYRRQEDGECRWAAVSGQVLFDTERRQALRAIGILLDITARKEVENRQRLALREMNHRVKNNLAVVQGIISQTMRYTPNPEEAFLRIQERVMALSRTNDFLDRFSWDGSVVRLLVASELEPFASSAAQRVEMIGPLVQLDSISTIGLGTVLHELASNAVRHGALSVPEGRVEVTWNVMGDSAEGVLELVWREMNGPPVPASRQRGLGARLIEGTVRGSLRGTVRIEYPVEGFNCRLTIPLRPVTEFDETETGALAS